MNTNVLLGIEADDRAIPVLQNARLFIEESEKRFSRFIDESELSQLNRSAGKWTEVSEDMIELLNLSSRYFEETGGLFNPAILPALKNAGYDKSMERIVLEGPGHSTKYWHNNTSDFALIESSNRQVRIPSGMEIDMGGIAKGWIVEKTAQILKNYSLTCVVNAGGDITFIGNPKESTRWRVELENPLCPDKTAAVLFVGECSVVTSSIAKRRWSQNGIKQHHLIDPRTGEPAKTDWLSVTVVSQKITEAEAFAKALLIGGETEASLLKIKYPELAYITVDQEGRISGSKYGMEFLNEH